MIEDDIRNIVMQAFNEVIAGTGVEGTIPDTFDLTTAPSDDGETGQGDMPALQRSAPDAPRLVQQLLTDSQGAPGESRISTSDTGLSNVLQEASAEIAAQPKPAPASKTKSQTTQSGSGDSTATVIARTALSVLTLGAVPLISGIVRLFGGGKPEPPPPLIPYSLPPSIQFEAANPHGGTGFESATYSQEGLPRIPGSSGSAATDSAPRSTAATESAPSSTAAKATTQAAGTPQITVQVNAMDSRSFLDHSSEIAQAVREAMLNMHSLNDVVSDF